MIQRVSRRISTVATLVAALGISLAAAPLAAGENASAASHPTGKLTGTVLVVNQASDTVTLIDLATLEASMAARLWSAARTRWPYRRTAGARWSPITASAAKGRSRRSA